jgi:predicted negative regulator of RcsB-dependent stress response
MLTKLRIFLKEFLLTEYMTEQEQIEQIKLWIKLYGPSIIAGIALALVGLFFWNLWENHQNKIFSRASIIYDNMQAFRLSNDTVNSSLQANKLIKHYQKTPYANMAQLMLARFDVENKNYQSAIDHLTIVAQTANMPAMQNIAKIRTARIQLSLQKTDEALHTLSSIHDKNYLDLIEETTGDIYLQKNKPLDAKNAYLLALKNLPSEDVTRKPIIQMKIDNLNTAADF